MTEKRPSPAQQHLLEAILNDNVWIGRVYADTYIGKIGHHCVTVRKATTDAVRLHGWATQDGGEWQLTASGRDAIRTSA